MLIIRETGMMARLSSTRAQGVSRFVGLLQAVTPTDLRALSYLHCGRLAASHTLSEATSIRASSISCWGSQLMIMERKVCNHLRVPLGRSNPLSWFIPQPTPIPTPAPSAIILPRGYKHVVLADLVGDQYIVYGWSASWLVCETRLAPRTQNAFLTLLHGKKLRGNIEIQLGIPRG